MLAGGRRPTDAPVVTLREKLRRKDSELQNMDADIQRVEKEEAAKKARKDALDLNVPTAA